MRLAALLRREIAEGTLAPGMPTPSITTLSQQYGHARQTCAKALRTLQDEGLLTRIPGLGYYVKKTGPGSVCLTGGQRSAYPAEGARRMATHSTWWVIGNASNARRLSSAHPRWASRPMSRASVAGSQDT